MQIVLHTGAHFTEDERLMKCLLRNKGDFAQRGVAVPGPSKYRKLLKETLNTLRKSNQAPSSEAREVLMDAILDDEPADRMILSNAHFFGIPRAAVKGGILYPQAVDTLQEMARVFAYDDLELFMGISNPALFLPAAFGKSPREEMDDFLGGVDPLTIRWSELFWRIREALPRVQVTVWCNEDAPLVWAQIIREMAGLEHGEKIIGGFDLLSKIMSKEGMKRFRAYLKQHPVMSEIQKRRVMAAFLDKFALDDEIEEELDLEGWTDELVEDMTEVYDEDVFALQRLPGVTLISP